MRYFLFHEFDDGYGPIELPPLAGLSGRNARFEMSDAIINTTAPLPSLPGRKPSFAALLMFHRAKLSVPVGQANRGGLVFVYAGSLQLFRSCQASWHGARSASAGNGTSRRFGLRRFGKSFPAERTDMKSPPAHSGPPSIEHHALCSNSRSQSRINSPTISIFADTGDRTRLSEKSRPNARHTTRGMPTAKGTNQHTMRNQMSVQNAVGR